MSKSRFTTTDVQAMVRDIRANVMGQRVANVYDLSEKCYLLKFAVPGKSEKITILVESGIRFHTTKYARDLPELPSAFAMKLRKYVRTKRLEDVRQIGIDRVVDFKFGSGDAVNHIILEMYANGNIILTDGNYEVLALLRSHQFADDVSLKVGELYPIGYSTNAGDANTASGDGPSAADAGSGVISAPPKVTTMSLEEFKHWAEAKLSEHREFHAHEELAHAAAVAARQAVLDAQSRVEVDGTESSKRSKNTGAPQRKPKQPQAPAQSGPKRKKARDLVLKQLLLMKDSGVASCGLEILDHCLVRAGLRPGTRVEQLLAEVSQEALSSMQRELAQAGTIVDALNSQGMPGYIIVNEAASAPASEAEESASAKPEFVEFLPMLFAQHEGKPHLTFGSFDEAVDEYYCKIEGQRLEKEAQAAELAAQRKIEKVQRDQEKMLRGLAAQQERMQRGASLLEAYSEEVDKVALVINSALGSGMTWEDIDEMVKTEAAAGNPIASLISRLNLQRNRVFLKLRDIEGSTAAPADDASALFDSDSDAEGENEGVKAAAKRGAGPKLVEVEFDLTMSAFANARKMYSQKKQALEKEARTADSAARALQHVGERVLKGVEDQKLKRNLRAIRKVHWFEKFNWCISSEGYLILSGRDAQQNEILFKRYLRPGDIYVHADIGGAASCIVRAKSPAMQAAGAAAVAAGLGTSGPAKPLPQERPISPLAIQEAGVMAVSRSSAWKGKVGGVAAWWVWANQVSKSAPTGEFLTAGSFMIYGKKNFLPPMALEMGFGVMFRLDDASVGRHLKDWKDRSYLSDDQSVSQYSEVLDRYAVDFNELSISGDGGEGEKLDATVVGTEKKGGSSAASSAAAAGSASKLPAGKPEKVSNSQLKKDKRAARKKGAASQPNLAPIEEEVPQPGPAPGDEDENDSEGGEVGTASKSDADSDGEVEYRKLMKGGKSGGPLSKKGKVSTGDEDEEEDGKNSTVGGAKKKHLSKKKARRYAEQDEEDRELAMLVLGHSSAKTGERLGDKQAKAHKEKKSQDLKARQEKAGIGLVKEESWDALLELLPEAVRAVLEGIISGGFLKAGELDAYEMKALGAFPPEQGVEILYLFSEGSNLKKAGNKSGFLAGIMRRYSAEPPKQQSAAPAAGTTESVPTELEGGAEDSDDPADQSEQTLSRRALKKKEQEEIQAIIDEEGIAEEEEGKQADDVEKLTGMPLPDDVLLYAIPVCGPYASMQNVRYKVKLTPGLGKKGKICKQALELFSRAKELTAQERALMNGLTDPEMVSIMIGDARISMPGLHQLQQAEKKSSKRSRGQKK